MNSRILLRPSHGQVIFSPHSLRRYVERVEPGLTEEDALTKLHEMKNLWRFTKTTPKWFTGKRLDEKHYFIKLDKRDDVAFIVRHVAHEGIWMATTCLTSEKDERYKPKDWPKKTPRRVVQDTDAQWKKLQELREARSQ